MNRPFTNVGHARQDVIAQSERDACNRVHRNGWRYLLAIIVVALPLMVFRDRAGIPPLVESDYCYQLTAADRFLNGEGLTTTPPVAPGQHWDWSADWTFLTKWPIGYPLLVAGVRYLTGTATITACGWISAFACAMALVGWFTWCRRTVTHGVTSYILAALVAGGAVTIAFLVNPSTDLLIVAWLPYVLLITSDALENGRHVKNDGREHRTMAQMFIAGLLAGNLFWFRYASLFIPVGIGAYLIFTSGFRLRSITHQAYPFLFGTALPIVALCLINHAYAGPGSLHEQLNLGKSIGWNLSAELLASAWWRLTDLGFYDHHAISHWLFATWPVVLLIGATVLPRSRRALLKHMSTPPIAISLCVIAALLTMLIGATTLFGGKYHYVSLDRYYAADKPLYVLICVSPLLLLRHRPARFAASVVLLLGCSWIVQQEWARTYRRWTSADREVTSYGQWARSFTPNAANLYQRLAAQRSDDLIVVSNFHDYIELETKIPAIPVPESPEVLNTWIDRIKRSRGIEHARVYFVLDPNNRWRDYFLRPYDQVVATFSLSETNPHTSESMLPTILNYNQKATDTKMASKTGMASR